MNFKLLTWEDKICIDSILQSYILNENDLYVYLYFQEWIERKQQFVNNCTGMATPSERK